MWLLHAGYPVRRSLSTVRVVFPKDRKLLKRLSSGDVCKLFSKRYIRGAYGLLYFILNVHNFLVR
jgi:hypothetical protein